jgi:paraquat-inducible protein B
MEVGKRPTRDSTVITRMIEQGLRTRLELQSVVTGVLAVNLDFYPETPVRFVGEMEQLIEIPSIPSAIDVLSDALGDVPVQEIVGEFRTTMRQLKKFLSSKELNEIPTEVALTLKEVRDTARATNRLLVSSEELLMPLKSEARGVSDSLKEALSSFAKANREASILLGDDSKVISQIEVTLEEVNKGARAIYELLRFLERHPDALIKGKR